jgi:hypothetical protein
VVPPLDLSLAVLPAPFRRPRRARRAKRPAARARAAEQNHAGPCSSRGTGKARRAGACGGGARRAFPFPSSTQNTRRVEGARATAAGRFRAGARGSPASGTVHRGGTRMEGPQTPQEDSAPGRTGRGERRGSVTKRGGGTPQRVFCSLPLFVKSFGGGSGGGARAALTHLGALELGEVGNLRHGARCA